jgi:hypothetical protein
MSNTVLVIGESGVGKSTSIRNLDPSETFIINVLDKPLPFKGYRKNYIKMKDWNDREGNYYSSDIHANIIKCIGIINTEMPHIKNIVIDDWQYTMCNEYMRRATETGFAKFTEIGQHAWQIINALSNCKPDMNGFVLSHNDTDQNGKMKCKTIGKMLDEKITVEGMFVIVLHCIIVDGQHKMLTQNNGQYIAKSPMGMFDKKLIDNDLAYVKEQMNLYFNEDIAI